MLPLPLGLFERGELGIGKYDEKKGIGKRYVYVKTNKTHQICLTAYTPINLAINLSTLNALPRSNK
jgi:hypothetical protein